MTATGVLLATTVPGLEFIVEEEAEEICGSVGARYKPLSGRVFLDVKKACLPRFISSARSVENVRLIVGEAQDLRSLLERVTHFLKELKTVGLRFAVRAERITKDAPFTSLDLAREVGEQIRTKLGLEVSLELPDIPIYVEYEAGTYRFGLDLTYYKGLRDRPYRVFIHPSALNPLIAYAMCRLARPYGTLLDPFCGSGTIPLECMNASTAEAYCSDVKFEYIRGAVESAKSVENYGKLYFLVADVNNYPLGCHVDAVVSNPPFGIRERAVGGLRQVYGEFFAIANAALRSGGKVVIVTAKLRAAVLAAHKVGFELLRKIPIEEGGLRSHILVFTH